MAGTARRQRGRERRDAPNMASNMPTKKRQTQMPSLLKAAWRGQLVRTALATHRLKCARDPPADAGAADVDVDARERLGDDVAGDLERDKADVEHDRGDLSS